ncbi:MAG: hypothetical protein ACI4XG_26945 [Bradyrhizobium sp.]
MKIVEMRIMSRARALRPNIPGAQSLAPLLIRRACDLRNRLELHTIFASPDPAPQSGSVLVRIGRA